MKGFRKHASRLDLTFLNFIKSGLLSMVPVRTVPGTLPGMSGIYLVPVPGTVRTYLQRTLVPGTCLLPSVPATVTVRTNREKPACPLASGIINKEIQNC
jgi:hypothetical protein